MRKELKKLRELVMQMFEGREWRTEKQPVQRPKERGVHGMFEEHPGRHCIWRELSKEQ